MNIPIVDAKDVPTVDTAQMIEVDRAMMEEYRINLIQMMENAGRNLAHLARERFLHGDPRGQQVVVLAGTGGNGGGALVCARRLHNYGADVRVFITKPDADFAPIPAHQLDILRRMGLSVTVAEEMDEGQTAVLIIDGIIGYSLRGNPRGTAATLINWANNHPAPVLALDVPSGVDTASGTVYEPAIKAAATMTLALPKKGMLEEASSTQVGDLYLADISVPPELYTSPALGLAVGHLFATSDIVQIRRNPRPVIILQDGNALAAEAADRFVNLAQQAIGENGRFSVVLSGGSTPEAMHRLLAQSPRKQQVDWQNVHIFWGDERFVPPDDPASNERMARETLLNQLPIPAANIYPVPTVGLAPAEAARQYEQTIAAFFAPSPPRFDLIFLGMGPDGHTASLFPNQTIATSNSWVAVVTDSPKPPPMRLTLTYKIINQAATVIFLAAGGGKAEAIAHAFGDTYDPVRFPTQGVRLINGRLFWLLDEAAAQQLPKREKLV